MVGKVVQGVEGQAGVVGMERSVFRLEYQLEESRLDTRLLVSSLYLPLVSFFPTAVLEKSSADLFNPTTGRFVNWAFGRDITRF